MQGSLQRLLCAHGSILFLFAFISGFMIGGVAVGKLDGSVDDWKLAHMEALVNGIVLFVIADCLQWLALTESKARIVAQCLIAMAYCNMVFGFMRGLTGAAGYQFQGSLGNDIATLAGMLGVPLGVVAFTLIFFAAIKKARS